VDFSQVALQRARTLAKEQLRGDAGALETVEADVQTWVPQPRSYDLVLVVYLHLPEQQRSPTMRAAAEAVAPGGTLLIVGHDLENLTSGHGGPQDPAVLYRPSDVVTDIEQAQLVVVRADTAVRSLTDSQGQPAEALDALVLARRPG
jgi:SAM-dependent methyltransferase